MSGRSQVSAVVLAAGRSARMGEVKQLLRLGDATVLELTIKNLRGTDLHEIVLVLGFAAEEILRQLPAEILDGLKVVRNPDFEQGMASSLCEGLRAVSSESDAALIVLADQPFVRSETISRIAEIYRDSEAEIVIPFHKGQRGNPVLLSRSLFGEALMLEGDTGFRSIFSKHVDQIAHLEVDDEGVLLDIDSPGDYERLRSLYPFFED